MFLDLILWTISRLTTLSPKELVSLGNTSLTEFCVPLLLCDSSTPTSTLDVTCKLLLGVVSTWKVLGTTPFLLSRAPWSNLSTNCSALP